jgi:hypothetical protein
MTENKRQIKILIDNVPGTFLPIAPPHRRKILGAKSAPIGSPQRDSG